MEKIIKNWLNDSDTELNNSDKEINIFFILILFKKTNLFYLKKKSSFFVVF